MNDQSQISNFKNTSENNYILEYTLEGKKNEFIIFAGDEREIKTKRGDSDLRISTLDNKFNNFKFNVSLPGKFSIESSNDPNINIIHEFNKKREITLKLRDEENTNLTLNKNSSRIIKLSDSEESTITISKKCKIITIKFFLQLIQTKLSTYLTIQT